MQNGIINITDKEFELLKKMIYDKFGINLTNDKKSLVTGRLQKILKFNNFSSFNDYYIYVLNDKSGKALSDLINHISTNHTFFYREKEHFDYFSNVAFPEIVNNARKNNIRDLRIWCAGCSTGEEAYMIMILMYEYLGKEYSSWDCGLLATDISEKVLNIAKEGIYNYERMALLPQYFKNKYFTKIDNENWQVKDFLRREITFRRFNLMNTVFPFKKPFDIIFCRNVMIYFDQPARNSLVERFYNFTNNGGYLFIGHSETLGRESQLYKYVRPSVYKKVN